jgi:putative transcription antitermination factor YqgF
MTVSEGVNYLGIDWGAADIGLAIAHAETRIALAYGTVKNDRELMTQLARVIGGEKVGTVVIGIPSHVNRREIEYPGERLGKLLVSMFPVRVAYQDEMFTTKMAQANLIERGVKGVARHDDEEAARIILQEWLDRNSSQRGPVNVL